eukprot:Hpha_TRINITY_DN28823_c0_g1::TRINITY_DN28823_c0_g1_i1::g.112507::m.112507
MEADAPSEDDLFAEEPTPPEGYATTDGCDSLVAPPVAVMTAVGVEESDSDEGPRVEEDEEIIVSTPTQGGPQDPTAEAPTPGAALFAKLSEQSTPKRSSGGPRLSLRPRSSLAPRLSTGQPEGAADHKPPRLLALLSSLTPANPVEPRSPGVAVQASASFEILMPARGKAKDKPPRLL